MPERQLTRRSFLKLAGASAASLALPSGGIRKSTNSPVVSLFPPVATNKPFDASRESAPNVEIVEFQFSELFLQAYDYGAGISKTILHTKEDGTVVDISSCLMSDVLSVTNWDLSCSSNSEKAGLEQTEFIQALFGHYLGFWGIPLDEAFVTDIWVMYRYLREYSEEEFLHYCGNSYATGCSSALFPKLAPTNPVHSAYHEFTHAFFEKYYSDKLQELPNFSNLELSLDVLQNYSIVVYDMGRNVYVEWGADESEYLVLDFRYFNEAMANLFGEVTNESWRVDSDSWFNLDRQIYHLLSREENRGLRKTLWESYIQADYHALFELVGQLVARIDPDYINNSIHEYDYEDLSLLRSSRIFQKIDSEEEANERLGLYFFMRRIILIQEEAPEVYPTCNERISLVSKSEDVIEMLNGWKRF